MTLRIPYESHDFPIGTLANGSSTLSVTWDDVLWAAVTVGRPNRQYVFRHGVTSTYEAIFRWSLVRMALEQRGLRGSRLLRTAAARTLDPSEKGAVNYFLGLTFCKLFADRLLNTPWLLHLDVFRPGLNPVLTGRSRPDLVGQEIAGGHWHAFECKGRTSPPDSKAKTNAKAQAQRLISVDGQACSLHVGAVTYFRGDTLNFYWRDPTPDSRRGIEVAIDSKAWQLYYGPIVETIRRAGGRSLVTDLEDLVAVDGADLKVGVHPVVAAYLEQGNYDKARLSAIGAGSRLTDDGYRRDGLKVVAGKSWSERFSEFDAASG